MRYLLVVLMIAMLGLPLGAQPREEQRVQSAGTAMKEILNVPDDLPQQLLDKAECVIVLPSVIKFAFVFGASYGRGAMTCRSGEDTPPIAGITTPRRAMSGRNVAARRIAFVPVCSTTVSQFH
jgi:lipid-binding SYLF domain-containing protein